MQNLDLAPFRTPTWRYADTSLADLMTLLCNRGMSTQHVKNKATAANLLQEPEDDALVFNLVGSRASQLLAKDTHTEADLS